jgi:hypothetical protein
VSCQSCGAEAERPLCFRCFGSAGQKRQRELGFQTPQFKHYKPELDPEVAKAKQLLKEHGHKAKSRHTEAVVQAEYTLGDGYTITVAPHESPEAVSIAELERLKREMFERMSVFPNPRSFRVEFD